VAVDAATADDRWCVRHSHSSVRCRVWKPFDASTQAALEASYTSSQPWVVQTSFRQWTYDVDVRNAEREAATQTNLQTKKQRRVRRLSVHKTPGSASRLLAI
jgi:hypothetical protein